MTRQMDREKALQKKYAGLQNQIKDLQEQYKSIQQEMMLAHAEQNEAIGEVSSTTNGEEPIMEDNDTSPIENE